MVGALDSLSQLSDGLRVVSHMVKVLFCSVILEELDIFFLTDNDKCHHCFILCCVCASLPHIYPRPINHRTEMNWWKHMSQLAMSRVQDATLDSYELPDRYSCSWWQVIARRSQ